MKDAKPIIFSGDMVNAILENRKSQTRRIVSPQPVSKGESELEPGDVIFYGTELCRLEQSRGKNEAASGRLNARTMRCPYGVPGDRLWVREKFFVDQLEDEIPKEKPDWFDDSFYYAADGDCCDLIPECACAEVGKPRIRPSIHMPRWASRLTLEVTRVKAERLNDISSSDARAEGIDTTDTWDVARTAPRDKWVCRYRQLWEEINGAGSWDANPWVWKIEFRKVEP